MIKKLKPPLLSTSFSESGKTAKNRFENILNTERKRNGVSIIALFVCFTLLCTTLISCSDSVAIIGGADGPTSIIVSEDKSELIESLFNAQTPYIGNASATGKILGLLSPPPGFEFSDEGLMELQTSQEPYGLTVNYKINDHGAAVSDDGTLNTEEFEKQAILILTLIENLGSVTFDIKDEGISYSKTVTAADAEAAVGRPLADYRSSLDLFAELYDSLFITYSPLDTAVAYAIFEHNKDGYIDGELPAEGHIILGSEKDSANPQDTVVYALTTYGVYGFENNTFVKVSGTGVIPAKIVFDKDMKLKEYSQPSDGSLYEPSLKELFPEEYFDRAYNTDNYEADYQTCLLREFEYAYAYLNSIGRDAQVSGQIEDKQYLSVSAEDSNALWGGKYNSYPTWIGTREVLEDGIRVVYKTHWQQQEDGVGTITFTKYEYDTGKTLEEEIVSVKSEAPYILPLS